MIFALRVDMKKELLSVCNFDVLSGSHPPLLVGVAVGTVLGYYVAFSEDVPGASFPVYLRVIVSRLPLKPSPVVH